MTFAVDRWYRLVPRGGPGLACDPDGLALGALELTRARTDDRGVRRCEVRPPHEIGDVLRAAYGPQRDEAVQRLHRGLTRAAARLDAGDLGHAGIEAVMLGVPDLTPGAVAKLIRLADLEKRGAPWEDEPRVPKRHTGGGRWTTDGAGALSLDVPLADDNSPADDAADDPPKPRGPRLIDAVYRPGVDSPFLIAATGPPEVDEEPFRGSNGPPPEFTPLQELFPSLKDAPGLMIPLAPIDGFLGFSATVDATDVAATQMMHEYLISQIKAIDPRYDTAELFAPGGIAAMSWPARRDMIERLLMDRAVAIYRTRNDIGPLQVQILAFLRKSVDDAYAEIAQRYDAGYIQPKLSREEAIGNRMDVRVRTELQELFNGYNISYGKGQYIIINNNDYDTSQPQKPYRRPDARLGNMSFDWTLESKRPSKPQIIGFFNADAKPVGVVIIRPSQLGRDGTYMITRPNALQSIK